MVSASRMGLLDTSQVGWRMADHHFVHQEAQSVVDPLLDRQPVQFLECRCINMQHVWL